MLLEKKRGYERTPVSIIPFSFILCCYREKKKKVVVNWIALPFNLLFKSFNLKLSEILCKKIEWGAGRKEEG